MLADRYKRKTNGKILESRLTLTREFENEPNGNVKKAQDPSKHTIRYPQRSGKDIQIDHRPKRQREESLIKGHPSRLV